MKIIIMPTNRKKGKPNIPIIISDTGDDNDATYNCVELALRSLVAAGHNSKFVWMAAIEAAEANK